MNDDVKLVREILKGNMDSFNLIIGKYEPSILNFTYRMVRNYEAAQDITQEVFITLYNRLYTYKQEHKFSNWLFQIARNKTVDYIRKYRRVHEVNIEDAENTLCCSSNMDESINYLETRQEVEGFMKTLNETDRQILILKYGNRNSTFSDIAQILGMGESAVKGRYYRLKDKFKTFIQDREERCRV